MKRPRVNERGEVDIQSVEALSRDDLLQWVYDRLHGKDLIVPGGAWGDDMPHYLFAILYPDLNPSTREDLQGIVLQFMTDLTRNPESEWLGEPGSELLMLVDPVLIQSPRRDEAVDLLLEMADSSHLKTNTKPNLHFRVLQGLGTLRHRADEDFWGRQFQMGGERYAPVVLGGLALLDVSAPFKWLTSVPWSDAVEDAIIGLLPSLLEDYGTAKVISQIERILPNLQPEGREALLRFCEEEGLTVAEQGTPTHTASDQVEGFADLSSDPEKFVADLCGDWSHPDGLKHSKPACAAL